MQAAINRGPHVSALVPEAIEQLQVEVKDKVKKGQARVVLWDLCILVCAIGV
jgi:multidrug efflux pump subunit AcrA (membrane-fusion protein)